MEAIAPAPIIRQIQHHQPDSLLASPAFLERLIDYCFQRQITLPSIQKIYSGGAPITPRLLWQLKHLAPQAIANVLSGSTEAEPISLLHDAQPAKVFAKGLCVGQPIPDLQLKILPFDFQGDRCNPNQFESFTLDTNQVGEIIVAGDHVLKTYLKGLGDRHNKIQVSETIWHRTGDAGYLDQHHNLWLVGRCTECRNLSPEQNYPFILETALQQHPKVKRAAAITQTNQQHLFIEQYSRIARIYSDELNDLLQQDLDIHFVRKIPVDRRHNSKILYRQLKNND